MAIGGLIATLLIVVVVAGTACADSRGAAYTERIFVTNEFGNTVTVYPVGNFGNLRPLITYSNSDALFGCSPDSQVFERPSVIALDRSRNIYVANDGSWFRGYDSVTVFGRGKSPMDPPIRAICTNGTQDKTGFGSPRGVAVDGKGYVYVINFYVFNFGTGANLPSITIYPPGSNGDTAPVRTVTGKATGLSQPTGLAIDSSGFLYALNENGEPVAPGGSITVYGPQANGNAVPLRVISGTNTSNVTGLDNPAAIALDRANNIYTANDGSTDGAGGTDSVTIYSANSTGNVKPIARIAGPMTQLNDPNAIAVDEIGNIYVANNVSGGASADLDSITVYQPGSNGNVAPAMRLSNGTIVRNAVIKGSLTALDQPSGIAIGFGW